MFIIPLTGKISLRNPPVATIGLILLNVVVFLGLQSGEQERFLEAMQHYTDSGLADIELPLFLDHHRSQGNELPEGFPPRRDWELGETVYVYHLMQQDADFTHRLLHHRIITPDNPLHHEWRSLRTEFEIRLSKIASVGYGFRPAVHDPVTLLTYMFLHGGFLHLLGNMVFLWLVGCLLEMRLGRIVFLLVYLVGGVVSVLLYWAIYAQSMTSLVGASGAIAALMGAFTVAFGRQRVKIFFSLGFYFNVVRIPGIILLPIWIGNELYQLGFGGPSNVAYVAHLGGLLGGAVLGYAGVRLPGGGKEALDEEEGDVTGPLLEEAYGRLGRLDLAGARSVLEEVLRLEPDNLDALKLLYNAHRQSPEELEFHAAAAGLLEHCIANPDESDSLLSTWQDYCRTAQQPALEPDLLAAIATRLLQTGHPAEAQKALSALAKRSPSHAALPAILLKLARAHEREGSPARSRKIMDVLIKRFPASEEADMARRRLSSSKLEA